MRPERILVPLDGSVLAEHALPYALSWAARSGAAEIVLVRVTVPTPGVMTSMEEHCRNYLEALAARVREVSGLPCRSVVRKGHPETRLLELVGEENPSLLVMTSHGYTGGKRFLLGSVAEKLARRATCPVMVIRGLEPQATGRPDLAFRPSFEPILVPVDGSANSERALRYCAAYPFLTGFVLMVRATDFRWTYDPREEALRDKVIGDIRTDLDVLLGRYREQIPGLRFEIQEDVAAEGILHASELHRAHLIVMATAERSLVERFFLGSVTERILHHAVCPVLLLPPGFERASMLGMIA